MSYRFDWDQNKAASNIIHHGISFDEASTVFHDPLAQTFDDDVHSSHEQREIIIGHSLNKRLLLVCFTERPKKIIRLISAREPTRRERKDYEENILY